MRPVRGIGKFRSGNLDFPENSYRRCLRDEVRRWAEDPSRQYFPENTHLMECLFWEISRRNQPRLWESSPVSPPRVRSIRAAIDSKERELVIGQWGLIPWFANTAHLTYATNNARFEEITSKASYTQSRPLEYLDRQCDWRDL